MKWFILMVGVLSGCALEEHMTGEEAARQFGEAYCKRAAECYPELFGMAYPTGGVEQCVTERFVAPLGDKKSSPEACSKEQVDRCIQDAKTMTCTTEGPPASCGGC